MNNSLTILSSVFLVGFIGYKTLSKNNDIQFDKVDKEVEKDMYEEELNRLAKELIDDMLRQVCIELEDEYDSNSYDVCSICSNCSNCSSFMNVLVD